MGGAALLGWVTVFLATREEGVYRSSVWRVHLANASRSWAAQVLPPGGRWKTVGAVPLSSGRQAAINMALDAIDAR